MKAYIFPGQGAQFEGMGQALYEESAAARRCLEQADEVLGFRLSDVMIHGTADDLKPTAVTQPAIFVHSIATLKARQPDAPPAAVAGHSLGEITALVCANTLSFESGLQLLSERASAMQRACDTAVGAMAAVINFDETVIEKVCTDIDDVVVPANYNTLGQLVISGTRSAVNQASERLRALGARMIVQLPVSGGFHSPLMAPARDAFASAVERTRFSTPDCPVYQNVTAQPETDPGRIRDNIVEQLTAPVRWTQTVEQMLTDGVSEFFEIGGKGGILSGMVKKIDRKVPVQQW